MLACNFCTFSQILFQTFKLIFKLIDFKSVQYFLDITNISWLIYFSSQVFVILAILDNWFTINVAISTSGLCHSKTEGISREKDWPIKGMQRFSMKITESNFKAIQYTIIQFFLCHSNNLMLHSKPLVWLWHSSRWI